MTRVCSNDTTHDIGPAGPTGGFCPVCGRRIVDAAPLVSGATDDLTDPAQPPRPPPTPVQPRQPPAIETRGPSRTKLYLIVAAVSLAVALAAYEGLKRRPSTHEFSLPNGVAADAVRTCTFEHVIVSFKNDGSAFLEGRASVKRGTTHNEVNSFQMNVFVYAMIRAGARRRMYKLSIPALVPSSANPLSVSQPFPYETSLFPTISDASIDVQCSP